MRAVTLGAGLGSWLGGLRVGRRAGWRTEAEMAWARRGPAGVGGSVAWEGDRSVGNLAVLSVVQRDVLRCVVRAAKPPRASS